VRSSPVELPVDGDGYTLTPRLRLRNSNYGTDELWACSCEPRASSRAALLAQDGDRRSVEPRGRSLGREQVANRAAATSKSLSP